MEENRKEILANFLAFFICTIIVIGIQYCIVPMTKGSHLIFIVKMVQYMIGYSSVRYFSRMFKEWKYYEILYKVVEFPNVVHPLIIKPYIKMFMGLFFFLSLTFMVIYFPLKHISQFTNISLEYSTKLYLQISIYTILIRSFGNQLIGFLVKFYYKTDNQKEHVNLTLSLVNEERIRYSIYLVFLVLLVYFSIINLEGEDSFTHKNVPSAVLNSFASFIAFDRLINNWSLIKFNSKRHWELLIEVYKKDPKYTNQENYLIKKEDKLK